MLLSSRRFKLLAPEWLVDPIFQLAASASIFIDNGHPLSDHSSSFSDPFYIVGSGRSGSTLLRSMLCCHSDIGIPPEFGGFRSAYRKYRIFSHLPWRTLVSVVLTEMESTPSFTHWKIDTDDLQRKLNNLSESERSLASIIYHTYMLYFEEYFPGRNYWGDKTPLNTFNLSRLNKVFPNAKYIHIVRDGRDVAASLLKANLPSVKTVKEAGYYWRDAISSIRHFCKYRHTTYQFLVVRYEDIVTNTEHELIRICDFLQVPFSNDMLEHNKVVSKLGDTHLSHHENVSKSISTKSIGKWKNTFTEKQYHTILPIIRKDLINLGYNLDD